MFKGITDSLKKVFGTKQEKDINLYKPLVEEVNEFYEQMGRLTNDELRNKTKEFRARIAEHLAGIDKDIDDIHNEANEEENLLQKEELFREMDKLQEERNKHLEDILKELLPEAFAVVKETARRFKENPVLEVTSTDHDRDLAATPGKSYVTIEGNKALWKNQWVAAGGDITWDMVHYDVQLIGGMVLHDGKIAEMATGEGKTLVATLPAYLNGLSGQGVHIVTVNDYLARRDSEWVGPIFEFLFLTVDCIDKYKPHSKERRRAYNFDITYGTNNEFGFDYLRDNMVRSTDERVQRKHHYAMVDEVDSVLIDDARTPLIISGPVSQGSEDQEYIELRPEVEKLISVQRKLATEYLAEARRLFKEGQAGYQEGEAGMALLRAYRALPKYRPLIKFLSEEGVKVELQKAENFYMQEQNKNMHLADEPLYFVIDEKNRSVELTERGAEFLSQGQSDENFFVMPDIATEMVVLDSIYEGKFYPGKLENLSEEKQRLLQRLFEEGLASEEEQKTVSLSEAEIKEKFNLSEELLATLTIKEDGLSPGKELGLLKKKGKENPKYELANDHLLYPILEAKYKRAYEEILDQEGEQPQDKQARKQLESLREKLKEAKKQTEYKHEEAKSKLMQDFAIKSKRLHSVNQLLKAYTLFERDEEYVVIEGQVKIVDEQTGRMMEGRRYSDGLHQALEAKENVKVGDITQTYATVTLQNYFRMYHKLAGMTGTAETEASEFWEIYKLDVVVIPTNRPIVRDDKEDLVFKTAREKFNAVIEEIVQLTEKGRPVLVGTTSVDISEKLSRMLQIRNIDHNVLNAKQHQREAEIVAEAGKPGKVTIATNMAGRGTDIKIGPEVKKAGGLAIVGTERHDSRRVDRQLRGRAGRQGDPGSSQFYVSLEDNLMRLFQSERIAKLMDRMGHQEGEVIQHSMVTKSIERAQKKVEENNFGIRKRLLEYDDVMNIQREAIYKKRDNALAGERLSVDLNNMFHSLTANLVENHRDAGDFETFRRDSLSLLGLDPQMDAIDFQEGPLNEVTERFQQQFEEYYGRKMTQITEVLLPHIRDVHENQGQQYKRILIPFTDGRANPMAITADIAEAVETNGKSIRRDIEKAVTLAIIDEKWKEHLRSMDELKDSVQAASFEQKDPLVVYKMEAYNLFEQLIFDINEEVTSYLSKGTLIFADGRTLEEAREQRTDMSRVRTNRTEEAAARAAAEGVSRRRAKPQTFKRVEKKVGRNDPCPCGSGKKYKHCHGRG
ncbi:MAG: preprotein translocase subunit SecA [Phaeodactylibacter sp.]|nr:preprotein translocase subunit SecA [Phaeodactylibacter sp.]